jgi:uncharacterized cysteine cluster protein YcgN (CxxCxxCC family)
MVDKVSLAKQEAAMAARNPANQPAPKPDLPKPITDKTGKDKTGKDKTGKDEKVTIDTQIVDPNAGLIAQLLLDQANRELLQKQQQEFVEQQNLKERQSAYDLLLAEFTQYGLGSLVEPLKDLVISGASPAEFTIKLRQTDAYKKRFAANADRIAQGLTALSESEYLAKEDAYQNIMRNYDLPSSYYAKDSLGTQAGFNKLIANDVSAVELEDRIQSAKDRVLNANPEVLSALKAYYPGIADGDILAYTLDPKNALNDIKRKISAAEIGGAALAQGLTAGLTRAEELAGYGVSKLQAIQGFQQVAEAGPRGSQLGAIYGQDSYDQTAAESEIFNTAGAAEAAKKRKKIIGLEQATFGGQSGLAQGALSKNIGAGGY